MMLSPAISQCPACSSLLHFKSDETTVIICSSCGAVSNRDEHGKLNAKPQFIISKAAEIIQPGTTGIWENEAFSVLGRFRAWFEESVFNYWTIAFANGNIALLCEGYGIYAIAKPTFLYEKISSQIVANTDIGDLCELEKEIKFILGKKHKAFKWEIEGELYIPGLSSSFTVLEFSATKGRNIFVFQFEKSPVRAYEATYTSFSDLQLKNLKDYNNPGKTFECSTCSKTIHVKTYPYAQSCACPSCGTFHSLKNGTDFKKEKSASTSPTVHLSIGAAGYVSGILYEIIGHSQKEEQNSYHSKWIEYTLFNPEQGFAFLSEYEGHWIYIKESYKFPVLFNQNIKNFEFNHEPFQLYNAYTYKVIDAKGEFPYNVFDNASTKSREYISPPEVWIQERDNKEGITWFHGQHIDANAVLSAFNPNSMPYQTGIGAVQPKGFINIQKIVQATVTGILLLLFIHFFISMSKQERVLYDNTISFPDSSFQVSLVTQKFVFDKWRSNVRFSIEAPVSNSWFELNATLINAQTGKEYSIEKGVEYYYGYSDGESWTEGGQKKDAYLTKIPAGTYFLQLLGTAEGNPYNKLSRFSLRITYDVPNTRNVLWAIVLLLIWPIGKYWHINHNEKMRWSNSPYSMYNS